MKTPTTSCAKTTSSPSSPSRAKRSTRSMRPTLMTSKSSQTNMSRSSSSALPINPQSKLPPSTFCCSEWGPMDIHVPSFLVIPCWTRQTDGSPRLQILQNHLQTGLPSCFMSLLTPIESHMSSLEQKRRTFWKQSWKTRTRACRAAS